MRASEVGGIGLSKKKALRIAGALIFTFQIALALVSPAYGGTTGIISGTVTDTATGEKLAGVNVIVKGTNLTTVTDETGYYVITNVPPGEHKVAASLVGYADAQMEKVSVLMDVTATVDFALEQSVAVGEEVVVTEARPMIQRDVVPTMYVVENAHEQMVRTQPNLLYQTQGIVITQPGVVADESGYPHIRGGRENQVGYMLDGMPITETLTNGFGTNCVTVGMDKMEIYTGGYRPEYGNAISGIFNQVVKTGQTAPGLSFETLGGSQAFRGLYPQVGGVTEKGLDYYVGAYLWYSELEGGNYNEVDSSDWISKLSYPAGRRDKLTLLAAEGSESYQFPSNHTQTYGPGGIQPTGTERDHTHQSHLLMALILNHTVNASSFFTVRPYYFRARNKADALSDDVGIWFENESAATGLQLDYTNQLTPKHLLKAGAIRTASENKYWANVPSLGTYEYTANTDTVQTGLYIQDQMNLGARWRTDAGLRYDRMKYDKEINEDTAESQLSPRFGLSYALDSRTNLRFSYGKMIQFVYTQAMERNYTDPDSWGWLYANADLKPERCTQYDLGWERQVTGDYSIQVTPFYRKFKDLLQSTLLDPDNPDLSPVIYDNLGEGTSKGIEVLIKRRQSKNWSGWLSYTYSKAKAHTSTDREFITPGTTQYVNWDQRHTIALVLNYMDSGWNYSLTGEYGSGLPYELEGETLNSRRVSSHATFNLNIAKEITGGWLPQGEVRLSIANLFNTGAALDRDAKGEPTARVAPRFISMSYVRRF